MDTEQALPGLEMDVFKAAVDALAELRKAGKFLFFYAKRNGLRLVGEQRVFRECLNEKLGDRTIDEKGAAAALREVHRFARVIIALENDDTAAGFLRNHVYEDKSEKMSEENKSRFDEQLRLKASHARQLIDTTLRERERRIRSATGPMLEDVDSEIVLERHDHLDDETIDSPFLRLRFRYTETTGYEPSYFWPSLPWSNILDARDTNIAAFELECDETDIDLMLLRLREAKKRLGDAMASNRTEP